MIYGESEISRGKELIHEFEEKWMREEENTQNTERRTEV
jgi:hypothetical protein